MVALTLAISSSVGHCQIRGQGSPAFEALRRQIELTSAIGLLEEAEALLATDTEEAARGLRSLATEALGELGAESAPLISAWAHELLANSQVRLDDQSSARINLALAAELRSTLLSGQWYGLRACIEEIAKISHDRTQYVRVSDELPPKLFFAVGAPGAARSHRALDRTVASLRGAVWNQREKPIGRPDTSGPLRTLAMLELLRGDAIDARDSLSVLRALTPDRSDTEHALSQVCEGVADLYIGSTYRARSHLEAAIRRLARATKPDIELLAQAHAALGICFERLGNMEGALEHWKKAQQASQEWWNSKHPSLNHPSVLLARYRVARALWKQSLFDELREELPNLRSKCGVAHPLYAQILGIELSMAITEQSPDVVARLSALLAAYRQRLMDDLVQRTVEDARAVVASTAYQIEYLLSASLTSLPGETDGERLRWLYDQVCAWRRIPARTEAATRSAPSYLDLVTKHFDELRRQGYSEFYCHAESRTRASEELRADPLPEAPSGLPPGWAMVDFVIYRRYADPVPADPTERFVQELRRDVDREMGLDEYALPKGAYPLAPGAVHVDAWVTRAKSGEVIRVRLGQARALREAAGAFLDLAANGSKPVEGTKESEQLYRLLWAPLVQRLGDCAYVALRADGFLGQLPFGAIPDPAGGFLLEKRAFVYSSLGKPEARSSQKRTWGPALVVGDPAYESGRLQKSGLEIRGVLQLFESVLPEDGRVTVLQGRDVTRDHVLDLLPKSRTAHFSVHGIDSLQRWTNWRGRAELRGIQAAMYLDDADVLDNGLRLVQSASEGDQDGLLTTADIEQLDLSSLELVVLASCSSGTGQELATFQEELLGFRHQLHVAGVQTVISTVWDVPDAPTSRLALSFYRHLLDEDMPVADALRAAQLELLESNRASLGISRPRDWGAFVLSGDWR